MTPASTFLQITKQAEAATLTAVRVVPASNLATMLSTYEFRFTTATNATIQSIEISFPAGFNLANSPLVLEKDSIGSGTITAILGGGAVLPSLTYTVNSPASIPAGKLITLEIGRIFAGFPGTFKAIITTRDTGGNVIHTVQSSFFSIFAAGSTALADNSILGNGVSPGFMIRKTLNPGSSGWNPGGITTSFTITDTAISGSSNSIFVEVFVFTSMAVLSKFNCDFLAGISILKFSDFPKKIPKHDQNLSYFKLWLDTDSI